MPRAKKPRVGGLPAKYNFVLNPYADQRLSGCPFCSRKTGQRKVPLFIHVDPFHPVAINRTRKYCQSCDLLMAHKHEVEHLLHHLLSLGLRCTVGLKRSREMNYAAHGEGTMVVKGSDSVLVS